MEVIKSVTELRKKIAVAREAGDRVGFVPTMGALHDGHLALVDRAVRENDCCVVSVFVNPTQFNDPTDFERYPRTLENDVALLERTGCRYVFAPSPAEVYPEPDTRVFDFGRLDKVMEGKYRPGHFNGVAQVVSRLFDIVCPDRAYFGEKDFQQVAVIRSLAEQLRLPVEIVVCPIVREASGLALSSRNKRLTPEQAKTAVGISETLSESRIFAAEHTVAETVAFVTERLNGRSGLRVEYYEIVDGRTLQPVADWRETREAVGCVAVFCGEVRLIDLVKYYE